MAKRSIAFSPPDITELEIKEVCEALRSGWITTGPRTKLLEEQLAVYCHTKRVVCLSSATAAMELTLRILGIGEGDEVLVPAYTYTATASAVIHVGATVKFIDSQTDSYEMDYTLLEAAITEKTKAVIAVDLAGIVCDYKRIYEAVLRKAALFHPKKTIQQALNRVAVIADSAHALGAVRDGKMAGEIADFTCFSFHAVKNLTTAEGGAATFKSIQGIEEEKLYRLYQLYSLHGQTKDALSKMRAGAWEYDIIGPWYKCNMTDIMAAIGLKQFIRYPKLLQRRHEIINRYDAALKALQIRHLSHTGEHYRSAGHLYIVRIPWISEQQRNEIIEKMSEQGIACNVHYKPLPMMSAYKALGWEIKNYRNAYHYYKCAITLPLHTLLTDDDVDYVMKQFKEIVAWY